MTGQVLHLDPGLTYSHIHITYTHTALETKLGWVVFGVFNCFEKRSTVTFLYRYYGRFVHSSGRHIDPVEKVG